RGEVGRHVHAAGVLRADVVVAVADVDAVGADLGQAFLVALPALAGAHQLVGDGDAVDVGAGGDRELAVDVGQRRRGRLVHRQVERRRGGVGAAAAVDRADEAGARA